jgi:hypothetical protein
VLCVTVWLRQVARDARDIVEIYSLQMAQTLKSSVDIHAQIPLTCLAMHMPELFGDCALHRVSREKYRAA